MDATRREPKQNKKPLTCGTILGGFLGLAALAFVANAVSPSIGSILALCASAYLVFGAFAWLLNAHRKADEEGRGMFNYQSRDQRETNAKIRAWIDQQQAQQNYSSQQYTSTNYPLPPNHNAQPAQFSESALSPELLKAKMSYARELIKAKNYQEARQLLQTINHPTAQKWLQQLYKVEYNETQPIEISTQRYAQGESAKTSSRKKKSAKKHTLRSILVVLILFACGLFTFTSIMNFNPAQPQPTVDISARMLSIAPESVQISDPNNTGIPRDFLDSVRAAVSPYGYVLEYVGVMNIESRFLSDVYVRLDETRTQYYADARSVIETVYRHYAREIDQRTAGEIMVFVDWNLGNLPCALSSGIGYRTIQRINWNTADQATIFNTIDRRIYEDGLGRGDGLTGQDYSEVAWAPHPNTITQCYE